MNSQNPVGESRPLCSPAPQSLSSAFGPPTPPWLAAIPVVERQPFTATRADGVFAIVSFLLGFFFIRWATPFRGWGVTAFTVLFLASVLAYTRKKEITPPKESWYWLSVVLLTGLSFSLWPGGWLAVWRSVLLLCTALYWCASLFGILARGKTSNLLPVDIVDATLLTPLRNYDTTWKTVGAAVSGKDVPKRLLRKGLPVLLGLVICIPLLLLILPQLAQADSDIFGRYYLDVLRYLNSFSLWNFLNSWPGTLLLQLIAGIPVALYLFWLIAGAAHKRYVKNIDANGLKKGLSAMAVLPGVTVTVILAALSLVYVLFIGCQIPYFFSGFMGERAPGFLNYATFARQGFFELCFIAGINLCVLGLAGGFCRTSPRNSRGLRVLNLMLSALTLLIIATAMSKMALYTGMYGLTPKRVASSVFMLFLAGVWLAVMVLQFRAFSIVRFVAVFGAGLLCALCLCNMEGQIIRYNAARYQARTLPGFDMGVALESGPAAAKETLALYQNKGHEMKENERAVLEYVLYVQKAHSYYTAGTPQDSLTAARARDLEWPALDDEDVREGRSLFYRLDSANS